MEDVYDGTEDDERDKNVNSNNKTVTVITQWFRVQFCHQLRNNLRT